MKAKDLEVGTLVRFGTDDKAGILVDEAAEFIRHVYIVHPNCEHNPVPVMLSEITHRMLGSEWLAVEPDPDLGWMTYVIKDTIECYK